MEWLASQPNAGHVPCARVLVGFAGQFCEAVVGPAAVQWPHRPEQKKHMAVPKRANAAKPAGRQDAANTGTSPACRSFQEDHRPGDADSDRKQSLRLFNLEEELLSSCSRTGQRERLAITPWVWENCHGPIAPAVPPWPRFNCR